MRKQKSALGRGMASLLGGDDLQQASAPIGAEKKTPPFVKKAIEKEVKEVAQKNEKSHEAEVGSTVYQVSVDQIDVNPHQPRKIFNEADLKELSFSIAEQGVLQPLIVTKKEDGRFELVAGERRLRASKLANIEYIPVIVKRLTERDKMIFAIVENVQRSDLNCVEEAVAYFKLMEEFKLTQEEVAKRVGKDRSTVANFLRLLRLPRQVLEWINKDLISFGHAKVLASIREREDTLKVAKIIVEEKISVRELEKIIKNLDSAKEVGGKSSSSDADEREELRELEERATKLREKLEQRTGFHFDVQANKKGMGKIIIKFGNTTQFNELYEFLMKR
jgi:ParB family transcriptional regulator, chromosome partitioning protein